MPEAGSARTVATARVKIERLNRRCNTMNKK